MKNEKQASNRRGRLILTAGLLAATITIGLIMKLQRKLSTNEGFAYKHLYFIALHDFQVASF